MKEKVVMYLRGGMMAGVFGAGIVTKLQDRNFYDRIEAIFCDSAGACNSAYFLSRQAKLGSSIYWEELSKGFIEPGKIIGGVIRRFQHRFVSRVKKEDMINPVDIDMLMDVFENKKRIDIEEIKRSDIPTQVKVFDTLEDSVEYIDLRGNPFQTIKEAIGITPYYFSIGQRFIDSGFEVIGFKKIRKMYPNNKIVICLNENPNGKTVNNLACLLEGIIASWMHPGNNMYRRISKRYKFRKEEIEKIREDNNSLLIYPPEDNPTKLRTTDSEKIKITWEMGQEAAEEILKFAG